MKKKILAGFTVLLLATNIATYKYYSDKLSETHKTISNLDTKIKTKSAEIAKLEDVIKIKDVKISEKNKKIQKQKKEIKKLEKKIENFKKKQKGSDVVGSYDSTMIVTAYTSGYESTQKRKGDVGYGITASGTYVKEGRTIACPKNIPFGTIIYIEDVGKRVCEDRGGAIVDGHIDLYIENLNEALKFGKKRLRVKILK